MLKHYTQKKYTKLKTKFPTMCNTINLFPFDGDKCTWVIHTPDAIVNAYFYPDDEKNEKKKP